MENLKDTIPSLLHCPAFDFLLSLAIVFLAISTSTACQITTPQTPTPLPPLPTPPPFNVPGERQLTDDPYLYESPVWSPDGEIIAIERNTDTELITGPYDQDWAIVLINVISGKMDVIDLGDGSINVDPTWSPDGSQLAFFSRNSEGDLKTSTNKLTILTLADYTWQQFECKTCSDPFWLKDGSILVTLVLGPLTEDRVQIGIGWIDPITGEVISKTQIKGMQDVFALSPSGNEILMVGPYASSPSGRVLLMGAESECSGIWRYDLDSEGPIPFIDSTNLHECNPSWSWDGSKLAYTVKNPFSLDPTYLTIADADGSNPQRIIEPMAAYYQIRDSAWSPDGTKIALVYGLVGSGYTQLHDSNLFIIDVPEHLQPKSE